MNIDEKTKIPLFAALVTIPFVIGGILWLTSIDAKATSAEKKLNSLEQAIIDIATIKKDIEYIRKSLDK